MNLMTALQLKNNYPENILITSGQIKDTGKWIPSMYFLRDGGIHSLMLSYNLNEKNTGFDTEEKSDEFMRQLAKGVLNEIKIIESEQVKKK